MKSESYIKRGSFPMSFMADMKECYHTIIEYARNPDSNLDVQFRGNYINIYYNGGNLIKLSGRGNVYFNEYYFYKPLEKKSFPSSDIQKLCEKPETLLHNYKKSGLLRNMSAAQLKIAMLKGVETHNILLSKSKSIVEKLKSRTGESAISVIKEMQKVMDDWNNYLVYVGKRRDLTSERKIQHNISRYNHVLNDDRDLVVLDIEYAVSARSPYANKIHADHNPRIDIVALDKDGQIYVMELKYGMKSVESETGASALDHFEDFEESVGKDGQWIYFIQDMKFLLKSKKEQGFLDDNLNIRDSKPLFAYIMKLEKDNDENNFKSYLSRNGLDKIPVFYLPIDTKGEKPSSEYYKLSKDRIR